MPSINLAAAGMAAIAAFVMGFLAHGPVFGKLWMKLANVHPTGNEKLKDMIPQMSWNLLANFVTALVLSAMYSFTLLSPALGGSGIWRGVFLAVWVWLGFLITTTSIEVIWMGRMAKLWLFESAVSIVVMAVMGAIIAAW